MNKYYVYLHCKATTGEVFYVGKGSGERAETNNGRSLWWKRVVAKYGYRVEYIAKNLSEEKSFAIERRLILLFGRIDSGHGVLINKTDGGEGVSGRKTTQETKDKISAMKTGDKHTTYDPTIHRWINVDGDVEYLTSQEMAKKYNLRPGAAAELIAGRCRTSAGWFHDHYKEKKICPYEFHRKGKDHPMYNATKYKWVRVDGKTEYLSKYDMHLKYGIRGQDLSTLISGKQKSTRGWFHETIKKTNANQYTAGYK